LPSSAGPGSTSFAPDIAPAYGIPHAFTWNIGTTSSALSAADRPSPSTEHTANECSTVERCEYSTPLGFPVVPDV
jgi:hypothetical protein